LARDTLVHIYWLYEISERLTATISAVLRTWHRVEIEPQRYEPKRDRWTEAMRSAAALPLEPFPNEVTWPSAAIDLMESPESLELQLEYPKKVSHRWQPANLKVQITTSADGAARGFKLPYMGKPRRPKRRGPAA
jgi:hypothetical protein